MGNFLRFNPSIVEFQTQCWFTYIKRFKRAEETLLSKGPRFCPTRQGTFPFNLSLLASKLDNRKIASQFCSPLHCKIVKKSCSPLSTAQGGLLMKDVQNHILYQEHSHLLNLGIWVETWLLTTKTINNGSSFEPIGYKKKLDQILLKIRNWHMRFLRIISNMSFCNVIEAQSCCWSTCWRLWKTLACVPESSYFLTANAITSWGFPLVCKWK